MVAGGVGEGAGGVRVGAEAGSEKGSISGVEGFDLRAKPVDAFGEGVGRDSRGSGGGSKSFARAAAGFLAKGIEGGGMNDAGHPAVKVGVRGDAEAGGKRPNGAEHGVLNDIEAEMVVPAGE